MIRREIKQFFNSKTYPHPIKYLKFKETYISWLFFTGDFVYKIKKPVRFSYLDFSTASKRKHFLEEELGLNRRIAEDIYLDVVPIVKKDNRIRLSKSPTSAVFPGEKVIDYALKMKEIPEKYYMPTLVKERKIKKNHIDKIAKIVADFHQKADTPSTLQKVDFLKLVKKNWRENFKNIKSFEGKTISEPVFKFIESKVKIFLKQNEKLFKERQRSREIKDCHGDLHTGNIFVTPSKIHIIDCVEFNKRFRFGDVTSDVAFLSMDLEFLGRKDLADYFIKRYKFWSKDAGILRFLDFYKCYYACVRGKVASFSLKSSKNFEEKREEAERYFSLAFRYARDFSKLSPLLVVICGNTGTGKTCLAKRLAEVTGFVHLRSDVARKEIFKIPLFEHKKIKFNRGIYAKEATRKVYEKIINEAYFLLFRKNSAILDATFGRKIFRDKITVMAKKFKMPYFFIECSLPEKTVLKRLKRRKREKEVSDVDIHIYLKKKEEFEPIRMSQRYYLKVGTGQDINLETKQVLEKILCQK